MDRAKKTRQLEPLRTEIEEAASKIALHGGVTPNIWSE